MSVKRSVIIILSVLLFFNLFELIWSHPYTIVKKVNKILIFKKNMYKKKDIMLVKIAAGDCDLQSGKVWIIALRKNSSESTCKINVTTKSFSAATGTKFRVTARVNVKKVFGRGGVFYVGGSTGTGFLKTNFQTNITPGIFSISSPYMTMQSNQSYCGKVSFYNRHGGEIDNISGGVAFIEEIKIELM